MVQQQLLDLRQAIDHLDDQLLQIFSQRAQLVQMVAQWKQKNNYPFYDPNRENQIVDRILKNNEGPLNQETLAPLFKSVIHYFREWEKKSSLRKERKKFKLTKQRVGIIGLGLLGASTALCLKDILPEISISGFDPIQPSHPELQSIVTLHHQIDSIFDCDVIILACPPLEIEKILRTHAGRFAGKLVIDYASTKKNIFQALHSAEKNFYFAGGHPIAGKSVHGNLAAEKGLFIQRPFVLCFDHLPQDQWPELPKILLEEFLQTLGSVPTQMSAEQHDQVFAYTSHLPQFLSTTLTLLIQQEVTDKKQPLVFGPALQDLTRLATSDSKMWKDVVNVNQENILIAMDAMMKKLEQMRESVLKNDFSKEFALAKNFKENDLNPNKEQK